MSNSNRPNKDQINKLLASKKTHAASLTPEILFEKVTTRDRSGLSEAITLLESQRPEDMQRAQKLLKCCLPLSGNSVRIGITGVPGVGKSTFIETFGMDIIKRGMKVAVLTVDPSSERSGGSILGDKTRMRELSNERNAYIRPTPSGGSLGGVARKTRESILLCEAAGFDVILIETVGVGQSEIVVHSMTDFFMLLMLAGAGDELQGIKRGIMEMADTILITKCDNENVKKANLARVEYKNALHLFPASPHGWIPKIETVSAITGKGIDTVWEIITAFKELTVSSGWFKKKRKSQQQFWMNETVKEGLLASFYGTLGMKEKIEEISEKLNRSEITSFQASELILQFYNEREKDI